jgi:hypothetical protein
MPLVHRCLGILINICLIYCAVNVVVWVEDGKITLQKTGSNFMCYEESKFQKIQEGSRKIL